MHASSEPSHHKAQPTESPVEVSSHSTPKHPIAPEIVAQVRPLETEINYWARKYLDLDAEFSVANQAEQAQLKPKLQTLYTYYALQCAGLRSQALEELNTVLTQTFHSLWGLNQAALANQALPQLLTTMNSIQTQFRQAEQNFKARYLKLIPPQEPEISRIMRDFLVIQLQKLEALGISNESAFQLACQTEVPHVQALKTAPQTLLFPEKLSLLSLWQNLNQLNPCYFGLRKYLLQKQMQPAYSTQELQKSLNQLQRPFKPERHQGWPLKLQSLPWQPPAKSYRFYLKAGYHWLQMAHQQGFENPQVLKRSLRAFHHAIRANPNRSEAFFGLAYLHALLDDLPKAQAFLALAQSPNHPEYDRFQTLLERAAAECLTRSPNSGI